MFFSKQLQIFFWMAVIAICHLSGNLGELEITPLPDSYCMMEADNDTDSQSTLMVYGNLSRSCDLHINPLSSSQILISIVAGNIRSTDYMYMYIERMGQLGVCSNRYVALMELQQPSCKVNFGNAAIQLHFRGDIAVGVQDAMVDEDHHLGCPEDVNQDDMVGALEGQTSNCKQVKGFGSVIQCVRTNHKWWVFNELEGWWEWESKPTSRCDVQCPDNCSCIFTDRQVVYNCSQNIQDLGKISSGFLLFPSYISHVDLSYNSISALTTETFMSIFKDIRHLDLSSNFLTTLPSGSLDYLYNVIHLYFHENSLATLDTKLFVNLHNLAFLFLYSNALVTLDAGLFANLHSLTYLYLHSNSLVTLDAGLFANLHSLTRLDLDSNALVTLDAGLFANLHNLTYLSLHYNSLVTLDAGLFANLHSLTYLYLHSNSLVTLDAGLFANLHSLTRLDLDSNALVTLDAGLFANLHSLTALYLHSNSLVTLDAGLFANLHSLTVLSLDYNALVTLDAGLFANLHNLTYLSLHYNSLVTLDAGLFANLHNLTYLSLHSNSLVTLDAGLFANLYNLITLVLDQNALVTLATHIFINLHKLNELSLIDNKLAALDHRTFHELVELRYLYINKNKISHLKDGTLSNLFLLEKLSVAFNQVTFLSFNMFEDLHSLVELDLSGNRLQTIPQIGHMTLLNKIDLLGNPLTKITKNMFSGVKITASIFVDQPEVCICYLNGSDTCFNTIKPSPYLTCNHLLSLTALTVFIWIIGCSAIFGNMFVVWWKRVKQRAENKVQSLLLSNLAMSDLLMGIYMIIIASADVYYGQYFPMNAESWRSSILCRIAGTLAITSSEASVLFVTFISIDRCITIKFPYSIHKLRVKSTRLISALVWAFSLTLGLTASILAGRSSDFYDNSHVCIGLPLAQVVNHKTQIIEAANIEWWESARTVEVIESFDRSPGLYFSVAVFIAFNMFCFLLILACYIGLIRAVSKTSSEAFRQREMAEEIRMTLKVSAIVLTDFFCWFPICLMGALVQIGLIDLPKSVFAWVVTFVLPINSAINPFLYTIATVITDRCSRRSSDPAHIQMQTRSPRVQSTGDITESQSERVGRQRVAPLAEAENTTAL